MKQQENYTMRLYPCRAYKVKSREWKKQYLHNRSRMIAFMLLTKDMSVRQIAKATGLSKTTIHYDLTHRLTEDTELYFEILYRLHKHRGYVSFTDAMRKAKQNTPFEVAEVFL